MEGDYERRRYELHRKLEEVIGTEAAATLMELLPRIPWREAVRQRDLDAAREAQNVRIDKRFLRVDTELARIESSIGMLQVELDRTSARIGSTHSRDDRRFERVENRLDTLARRIETVREEVLVAVKQ